MTFRLSYIALATLARTAQTRVLDIVFQIKYVTSLIEHLEVVLLVKLYFFLPASPKAKAGLGVQSLRPSVRPSVCPSVRPSVRLKILSSQLL